jgi:hypothetical protein
MNSNINTFDGTRRPTRRQVADAILQMWPPVVPNVQRVFVVAVDIMVVVEFQFCIFACADLYLR